jgi:Ulp1 family protease
VQVPQQEDGSGCGFWTIYFGQTFMARAPYYRRHIRSKQQYDPDKIWNKDDGKKMRTVLREHVEGKMTS